MRTLVISLPALADLGEIWDYIAADNRKAADALLETLHEKFELLQSSPAAGRERKNLKVGLRSFPVGRYVIFYRLPEETIEIVRVLHGARDTDALL